MNRARIRPIERVAQPRGVALSLSERREGIEERNARVRKKSRRPKRAKCPSLSPFGKS